MDLAGVRERLEAQLRKSLESAKNGLGSGDEWYSGKVTAYDAALKMVAAFFDEEKAKTRASLSLLQEPRVGTTVKGEGFAWVFHPEDSDKDAMWINGDENTDWAYDWAILPTLKALVSSGAAYVTASETEANA